MPTGYTAAVADGTITDLKTFALQCARAMGACITMCDDPSDKLPPRRFEPDVEYHTKELNEAQLRLDEFTQMSEIDRRAMYTRDTAERAADDKKAREERAAQIGRYKAMQEKVLAWEGAPEGLKEFIDSQLMSSINWDRCDDKPEYQAPGFEKWQADRLVDLYQDIKYASDNIAEEIARTQKRNEWLDQLWTSLEGKSE